jgi:type IV secretion system protein VirB10
MRRPIFIATLLLPLILPSLVGCDEPPPAKASKKLAVPKGENSLDQLLRKNAGVPPATLPGHLVARPTGLSFADQPVGSEASQVIELRNDGGAPLVLGSLHIAGHAADFTLSGACHAGLQLPAGETCRLAIAFRPTQPSVSHAELVVEGNPSLFLPIDGSAEPAPRSVLPAEHTADAAADATHALAFARQRQAASLVVTGQTSDQALSPARAQDYADAGLPGIVSSFPVDRSLVLTADRYIPAILENSLNSQLPGRAIAVVERPVFGEDRRLVLIPAGSRVIGVYRAQSKYGLARLDIAWSRILRPDGVTINLDAASADVMGQSGIPGDLDTRWAEKYGSALLVSVIGAGGDWALASNSTNVTSPLGSTTTVQNGRTVAANRFGNDMERLGQRMVEDNLDIRPVLTVPQGTRLLIIPTEDIWLRDPAHPRPVTPAKTRGGVNQMASLNRLQDLLPNLIELLIQSPAVQKAAPQTAQEILQSALLQQLRDTAAPSNPVPAPVTPPADPPANQAPP